MWEARVLRGTVTPLPPLLPSLSLLLALFPPCLSFSTFSSSLLISILLKASWNRGNDWNWGLWGGEGLGMV